MKTRSVDLTNEQLAWLQEGLDTLTIPLKADHSINIVSITYYGLELFSTIHLRVSWHNEEIEGWSAVSQWHQGVREKMWFLPSTTTGNVIVP